MSGTQGLPADGSVEYRHAAWTPLAPVTLVRLVRGRLVLWTAMPHDGCPRDRWTGLCLLKTSQVRGPIVASIGDP